MIRRIFAPLFALALVAVTPTSALASGTVDQSQEVITNVTPATETVAQSFTVGRAGSLDEVAVNIHVPAEHDNGATVSIVGLDNSGLPDTTILLSKHVTFVDGWNSIEFASSIDVDEGDELAIVIAADDDVSWRGDCANSYELGRPLIYWGDPPEWLTLAEYVDLAEPVTPAAWCTADFAFRAYVSGTSIDLHFTVAPNHVAAAADTPITITIAVTNTGTAPTPDEVFLYALGMGDLPLAGPPTTECTPAGACEPEMGAMNFGVIAAAHSVSWTAHGVFDGSEAAAGDSIPMMIVACIGPELSATAAGAKPGAQAPLPDGCVAADETVTVEAASPHITVTQELAAAIPAGGGPATFVMHVRATGNVPLSNVTLTDPGCSPVTGPTKTGGNTDNILEPWGPETWTYRCTKTVTTATTNSVTAAGSFGEQRVSAENALRVDVGSVPATPHPTPPPTSPSPSAGSGSDGLPIAGFVLLLAAGLLSLAYLGRPARR